MTTAPPVLPVTYGQDAAGRPAAVDLAGNSPHILIAAGTGRGLTTLVHVIAAGAARHGSTVRVCCPRQEDDTWTRGLPGVTVAREPDKVISEVREAHDEMYRRFSDVERGRKRLGEHPHTLLAIDDYSVLSGDPAGVSDDAALADIAAFGAHVRVTLLVAAHGLPGFPPGVLANFGTRIVLGRATEATALRLLGDAAVTRDVPDAPGNGTAVTGGSLPTAVRVLRPPAAGQ